MDEIIAQIPALVDCETEGWNTKNVDSLLSIIHPDMVWPWPPHSDAHDHVEWVFEFGRFDRERWRKKWHSLFDDYDLIHNNRKRLKLKLLVRVTEPLLLLISIPIGVIRLLERIFLGKHVFARFIQRCQMEAGRLSSRQEHCVILLGLIKKNNSS
jgi:hypothetical protein